MSDYDELDETDSSEDEDDERIGYYRKPKNSLLPAKQWIRAVINDRKKTTLADGTARRVKLTEEDVDKFLERFPGITEKIPGKTPTVLHAIFDMVHDEDQDIHIDSVTVEILVKRLALQAPHLLCVANKENQNPLYLAIIKKKRILADYMVADFSPEDTSRQHLVNALEDCRGNEKRKNCLHLAFEKALKPTTLIRMVKSASTTALEAVDNTGRRPMHYAIQYKHCNIEVIREFLAKDDKARNLQYKSSESQPTNTFLDVDENARVSVYREHVLSAKAHQEEHVLKRETLRHKERPDDREDEEKDVWDRWDEMVGGHSTALQAKSAYTLLLKDTPNEIMDEQMIKREREGQQKRQMEAELMTVSEASRDLKGEGPPGGRDALPIQATSISTPKMMKSTPAMVGKNSESKPEMKPKQPADTHAVKRAHAFTKRPRKTIDHEAAARVSKTVLRMLKLHYMRTRNVEKATWWLYETNPQDVQTFFDYRSLPSEIHEALFETAFKGTKFDEVLSSVHFPNVTVIWRKRANSKEKRVIGGPSRQDMKFFFEFLYKRGVRYILKVVVEEGGQSAHSDESVKDALSQITVEHLDWQKIDMDPELICDISNQAEDMLDGPRVDINPRNQIRQLDLQWSGNNATLRAWSEIEGLPLLPHLEIVNLIIPKDVILHDSDEWTIRKKGEFEERLNKNRLAISTRQRTDQIPLGADQYNLVVTVNLSSPNLGTEMKTAVALLRPGPMQGRPSAAVPDKDMNEHEWLKCTDAFAASINLVWASTLEHYSSTTNNGVTGLASDRGTTPKPAMGSGLEDEVIVALIDDGVSLLDKMLAGRVLEGKTFDYGDDGIVGQSYNSAQGHGTEMARCILRVCPMAKIYPIRLKTHLVNGNSQIVLKSAALAINAALEKNATIISMSWTIPVPSHSSPEKVLFEDAMRRAASRNVLLFCSSPDEGKFQTKYYPSAVQPEKMFRIGAAYDDGGAFRYAGKDVDFIFPGVEVSNTKNATTGSSIATALAAGLAATIIYCFKISALAVRAHSQARSNEMLPPTFTASAVHKLYERDVMKTAFSNIGRVNEEKFIQIWDELRPAVRDLEDSSKSAVHQKVQRIMKLCSNMRVL